MVGGEGAKGPRSRRLFGSVLVRSVDPLPHGGVEQLRGHRAGRRAKPIHCNMLGLEEMGKERRSRMIHSAAEED